jgi:hypothetical protein
LLAALHELQASVPGCLPARLAVHPSSAVRAVMLTKAASHRLSDRGSLPPSVCCSAAGLQEEEHVAWRGLEQAEQAAQELERERLMAAAAAAAREQTAA